MGLSAATPRCKRRRGRIGVQLCVSLVCSVGEELVDFWILAEKILSIDEMDLGLRDYYLSLLLVLRATHLQEGSRVVTLCNVNISKNCEAYLK